MYSVVKRDGTIKEFNLDKIINAIRKAFDAVKKEYTDEELKTYTEMLNKNSVDTGININDF